MIFLRVLPKIFLWPTTRGPQELGGPGSFFEPPEPPVPTPLTPVIDAPHISESGDKTDVLLKLPINSPDVGIQKQTRSHGANY